MAAEPGKPVEFLIDEVGIGGSCVLDGLYDGVLVDTLLHIAGVTHGDAVVSRALLTVDDPFRADDISQALAYAAWRVEEVEVPLPAAMILSGGRSCGVLL